MKKSEAIFLINKFIDENGCTGENLIQFLESNNIMHPSMDYYGEDCTPFWEMEDNDYARMIAEQDNIARDLPTASYNKYTDKFYQRPSNEMAHMWNNGATISEIADAFDVTEYRVRTCLRKLERIRIVIKGESDNANNQE